MTEDYSPDPTLTPQQHRIIALLASGNSITQAAASENLHRNTIANWRRTIPAFARELEFAQREQRHYWHEQATRLAPLAIQAIEETLTSPNASPSLRFRAAALILKLATDPKAELAAQDDQKRACRKEIAAEPRELASFVQSEETPKHAQTCTRPQPIRVPPQPGRNTACPCKSGLKYKRCCITKAA